MHPLEMAKLVQPHGVTFSSKPTRFLSRQSNRMLLEFSNKQFRSTTRKSIRITIWSDIPGNYQNTETSDLKCRETSMSETKI